MRELDRLIGYLQANNLVRNNGFFSISDKELNEVLLNLIQFERPDMYAVLDDKVVLLEHFQFDASYSNKKDSMTGKQTEEHLKREREKFIPNGEIAFEKVEYKKSFEFWQTNFERCLLYIIKLVQCGFNESLNIYHNYSQMVEMPSGYYFLEVMI